MPSCSRCALPPFYTPRPLTAATAPERDPAAAVRHRRLPATGQRRLQRLAPRRAQLTQRHVLACRPSAPQARPSIQAVQCSPRFTSRSSSLPAVTPASLDCCGSGSGRQARRPHAHRVAAGSSCCSQSSRATATASSFSTTATRLLSRCNGSSSSNFVRSVPSKSFPLCDIPVCDGVCRIERNEREEILQAEVTSLQAKAAALQDQVPPPTSRECVPVLTVRVRSWN